MLQTDTITDPLLTRLLGVMETCLDLHRAGVKIEAIHLDTTGTPQIQVAPTAALARYTADHAYVKYGKGRDARGNFRLCQLVGQSGAPRVHWREKGV